MGCPALTVIGGERGCFGVVGPLGEVGIKDLRLWGVAWGEKERMEDTRG